MTFKIISHYLGINILGSVLYFSLIDLFGISAPFLIVIHWLMFDNFLNSFKSGLNFNKKLFILFPPIFQNFFLTAVLFIYPDFDFTILGKLFFSIIGVILIGVTFIEIIILWYLYEKHEKKCKLGEKSGITEN